MLVSSIVYRMQRKKKTLFYSQIAAVYKESPFIFNIKKEELIIIHFSALGALVSKALIHIARCI